MRRDEVTLEVNVEKKVTIERTEPGDTWAVRGLKGGRDGLGRLRK